MDAKQYVKRKMREYDPSIDTSPGSAIGDLFINSLGAIFQDSLDFDEHILNVLSIVDPEQISEDELDAVASNFFVERITGNRASGYIRIFYSEPLTVNIPKGTTFQNPTTGLNYIASSNYSITKQMMTLNNAYYPLYSTADIAIEAVSTGNNYITRSNTITNIVSKLVPEPASARNLQSLAGGTDKETNTAFADRIRNSINNKSVASPDGIKRTLKESFPSISSLTVISAGDTEMVRDITYSGVDVNNYYLSDFSAKVSGLNGYPYNESWAYVGRFADTDETTAIALPDPADFTYEFTNDMYKGLYRSDDPLYAELAIYNILDENFNQNTRTGYDDSWVLSDGQSGKDELISPDEIVVNDQSIKLGVHDSPGSTNYEINTSRPRISINVKNYNKVLGNLRKVLDIELVNQARETDSQAPSTIDTPSGA